MICCFRIKRVKRLRVFAVFALLLPRVFAYTTATIIGDVPISVEIRGAGVAG